MQAGDDASWNEWTDKNGHKCEGMRKAGAAKHGIVRTIDSDGDFIQEATYFEDKLHGLCFFWDNHPDCAFEAFIYNYGE
jgi:hypothetical protein